MKINSELIATCPQFLNTLGNRELDLRNTQLITIENLGILRDQFDSIDFSNNEIFELNIVSSFPFCKRLNSINVSKNKVRRIVGAKTIPLASSVTDHNNTTTSYQTSISGILPNLRVLILTSNQIKFLFQIKDLQHATKLEILSLKENPVCMIKYYRAFVVFLVPSLRYLDYKRITESERKAARRFFKSRTGKKLFFKLLEMGANGEEPIDWDAEGEKGKRQGNTTKKMDTDLNPAKSVNIPELAEKALEIAISIEDVNRIEHAAESGNVDFLREFLNMTK